jgi:hypothetical protein
MKLFNCCRKMRVTIDNTLKDEFRTIELEENATVEDLKGNHLLTKG